MSVDEIVRRMKRRLDEDEKRHLLKESGYEPCPMLYYASEQVRSCSVDGKPRGSNGTGHCSAKDHEYCRLRRAYVPH